MISFTTTRERLDPLLLLPFILILFTIISQGNGFTLPSSSSSSSSSFIRNNIKRNNHFLHRGKNNDVVDDDDVDVVVDDDNTYNKNNNMINDGEHTHNSRRLFLQDIIYTTSSTMIVGGSTILASNTAYAMEVNDDDNNVPITSTSMSTPPQPDPIISPSKMKPKKPFAPLQALLPAARVKLTIENGLQITNEIIALENDTTSNVEEETQRRIQLLEQIILERERRGFMTSFNINQSSSSSSSSSSSQTTNTVPTSSTSSTSSTIATTLSMPTSNSKLNDESYKEKFKNLPLSDKPLAVLSVIGDKRQFNNLQSRQRYLESQSPIRQALNYYTKRLQFNTESYVLNASVEEKKKMIRNDSLPDIKSVIVSDLDLRDLVRNQILDAFDDVRAELQYQIRNNSSSSSTTTTTGEEFDLTELRVLLLRAQKECNEWFSFIDANDVQEAMDVVSMEVDI